jgi:DNA-directed RNA polymerase subunit H (RpoH/RPB5)
MKEGKISEHDLSLLHLTDSPAEVVKIIRESQSSLRVLDRSTSDEYRDKNSADEYRVLEKQ